MELTRGVAARADSGEGTWVYLLPLSECEKLPDDMGEKLFPCRAERIARLKKREDRLRSFGVGALLAACAGLNEDEIKTDALGKPRVEDGSFFISISHGGDYASLALSSVEVGTDIEPISSKRHSTIVKRVATREECEYVGDSGERFLTLWTLKESVGKLIGKGLNLGFSSFSVLPLLRGESIILDGKTVYGATETVDGHVLSVATEKRQPTRVSVLGAEDILEKIKKKP